MKKEYLDIVDENDNVVAKDTRENIYKKGLDRNIRVVNVLIFNSKGELLLPKRSMNRRIFPGCYDFSCGEHVLAGEDYYDAATRGLEEELGIKNAKLVELGKLTPKDEVSCFMKVYSLTHDGGMENYDRDGIDDLSWFDFNTIEGMIEKDKKRFKEDLPIVLEWYLRNSNDEKNNELTCKTGLKKNIIGKEVFEREIALCKKLSKENGGKCGWGECKSCGVIPFLYKLHKGELLEDPEEINETRRKILDWAQDV